MAAGVGIRQQSREVQREYERAYYARNRDKLLQKSKDWQSDNPETVLRMRRAYTPQRAATMRKLRYGLTDEKYQAMLIEQKGLCKICNIKMSPPHVDHNHATNKVRGLLCDNCNRGIGHLKENITTMKSAIKYLKDDK